MKIEKIGLATLILADCKDVLSELPRHDALITDPPYGIGISSNPVRQAHAKKDWDASAPSLELLQECIAKAEWSVIWGGNYFALPPAGKGFFIWDKCQPEAFSLAMCEMAWTNIDAPAKMLRLDVKSYSKQHSTQKPVDLIRWIISKIPRPCTSILDPFLGSGTTAVAAIREGIPCTGIERDPEYFALACERAAKAQQIRNEIGPAAPQMDLFI